jgi:membrane-associated phospholipid phosphatase
MSQQPFSRSNVQPFSRHRLARRIREEAAEVAFLRQHPNHRNNGEESDYSNRNYIANYSKGLDHSPAGPNIGEVIPQDYNLLLRALTSGSPSDFEAIPLGGGATPRKLINPQSGLAFDLEGPDCHALAIPPAPRIDSIEAAGEMAEAYWMALARDINFNSFETPPPAATPDPIGDAVSDLAANYSTFPRPPYPGGVTRSTIFRGFTRGDLIGRYISQFLLLGGTGFVLAPITPIGGIIPFGSLSINQRQQTIRPFPSSTFLTTFASWLNNENGVNPIVAGDPTCGNNYDNNSLRFIRNMRDLANYVHYDDQPQPFWNACLILQHLDTPCKPMPRGPADQGNPYRSMPPGGSLTQEGFGTLGDPNILALIGEVTTRALKAAWFQKWFVHRRMRPEEFGALIEKRLNGAGAEPPGSFNYPIHPSILSLLPAAVLPQINATFGSFLLPQVYPEGCPLHPSYPSGHAVIAGACATLLKAWFDESFVIPNPVMIDPGTPQEGTKLTAAVDNAGNPLTLTVGDELNKLASNIAIGRNMAGVHYRSDYVQGLLLGEAVAIGLLEEQKVTYNENFSFTLTRFDGTGTTI